MRPVYNWTILAGERVLSRVRIKNPDKTPYNLTGATLIVRPTGVPISASIVDAPNGVIQVELTSSTPGRYPYQLAIRWPDGQEWIILRGSVVVQVP